MTSYAFFKIQQGIFYEDLKKPLMFQNDSLGLSNWILRFPLAIYSNDLKQKHVFTNDTVTISTNHKQNLQEKWKYFVITKQDGCRVYCTSQIYYERKFLRKCIRLSTGMTITSSTKENQYFYVPGCVAIFSDEPYYKMQVNILKIFRQLRKPNNLIHHTTNQHNLSILMQMKEENRQDQWKQMERTIQQPSVEHILDYYIGCWNNHLSGEALYMEKSVNCPMFHAYKLNKNQIFQVNHFINLPLSPSTLRLVISAILLQKQIIFTSSNINLNVLVIQSILQIIRPFQWFHMYVPNLPGNLFEAARQNFMPFIIGIQNKYLDEFDLEDKCVVYIDEDRFDFNGQMPCFSTKNQIFLEYTNDFHIQRNKFQVEFLEKSIKLLCKLLQPFVNRKILNSMTTQEQQFFDQFYKNTSMFSKFKQDFQNNKFIDLSHLLQIQEQSQKCFFLNMKINIIYQQILSPTMIDNKKQWNNYNMSKIMKNIKSSTSNLGNVQALVELNPKRHRGSSLSRYASNRVITRQRFKTNIMYRDNRQNRQKLKISINKLDRLPLKLYPFDNRINTHS